MSLMFEEGEGTDYEKRARLGAFLVFSGRKADKHVRHAHTGVSYVLCRMRKTRPNGRVFRVFRVLERRGGGWDAAG